jgi:hypothetical protein
MSKQSNYFAPNIIVAQKFDLKEEHLVKSNQVRTTIEIKSSDCRARIAKMASIVVKT